MYVYKRKYTLRKKINYPAGPPIRCPFHRPSLRSPACRRMYTQSLPGPPGRCSGRAGSGRGVSLRHTALWPCAGGASSPQHMALPSPARSVAEAGG